MEQKWKDLLFNINVSIRYHSRRADFFGLLTKLVTAISMIAGSGVVATAIHNKGNLPAVFGIIVAITSAISLTFGYSSREQLHNKLKRKFIELKKSMVSCENKDEKNFNGKIAEKLTIESDEPAMVKTLNMACYNEVVTSQGYGKRADINWFRSLFCQIDLPFLKPDFAKEQDENKNYLSIIFAISFTVIFLVLSYMFLPEILPESFLIKFRELHYVSRIAFLSSIVFIVTCFFVWIFCKIGKARNKKEKMNKNETIRNVEPVPQKD